MTGPLAHLSDPHQLLSVCSKVFHDSISMEDRQCIFKKKKKKDASVALKDAFSNCTEMRCQCLGITTPPPCLWPFSPAHNEVPWQPDDVFTFRLTVVSI